MAERPKLTQFNGNHHLNLGEAQTVQRRFEEMILPPQARTPSTRITRFMQEAIELVQMTQNITAPEFDTACVKSEGFAKAVGMEAVDTIIVALGIIDALGLNAEQLFMYKMEVNFFKYRQDKMEKLLQQGVTHDEAQAQLKKEWDGLFPKDEFSNHQIT